MEQAKGRLDPGLKYGNFILKKGIGEPHDEDYLENEKIIKEIPLIAAQIEVTVDFVMRAGWYLEGASQPQVDELTLFLKNLDFDQTLRTIVRHMLIYGNAYVEIVKEGELISDLKVWHPKDFYVKRDEQGNVEEYNQWFGWGLKGYNTMEATPFTPDQIAHFVYNRIGNDAYGTSMIKPMKNIILQKLKLEKDMITIIRRKAGAPYVVTVGDMEHQPTTADVADISKQLYTLTNSTEWVFPGMVKVEALGFADKIIDMKPYLEYMNEQLMMAGRVPEVLLGKGSIPEGLAKYQTEMFEGRATSIQESISEPVETNIFNAMGVEDIEFKWGQPTAEDKFSEIEKLTNLINANISDGLRMAINDKIAELLELEVPDVTDTSQDPAAQNAGDNTDQGNPQGNQTAQKFKHIMTEELPNELTVLPVKPELTNGWVSPPLEGEYAKKLKEINSNARVKAIGFLRAIAESKNPKLMEDLARDKYKKAISTLSAAVNSEYSNAPATVRPMTSKIYDKGRDIANSRLPGNILPNTQFHRDTVSVLQESGLRLVAGVNDDTRKRMSYELQQGVLKQNSIDQLISRLSQVFDVATSRLETIARTETIRALTQAEVNTYKDAGINKVQWITAQDERVEFECAALDGMIFDMSAKPDQPLHPNCYDNETDIYTDKGWKRFGELDRSEKVLTINPETLIPVWQKPISYIKYPYEGKMINFKSNNMDLLVTPNHEMLAGYRPDQENRKAIQWRLVKAKDIKGQYFLKGMNWVGNEVSSISIGNTQYDAAKYCRFMGYYLSEGSVVKRGKNWYQISIAQTKHLDLMYEHVKDFTDKARLGKDKIYINDVQLGEYLMQFGKSWEKFIPEQIKQLNSGLIRLFLYAYLLGDGTIKKGKDWKNVKFKDSNSYFTSSKRMADDLSELILKTGGSVSMKPPDNPKIQKFKNGIYQIKHTCWIINELTSKYAVAHNKFKKEIEYTGDVHCVEVPEHHTLLVRRNGKVMWCGNCRCDYAPVMSRIKT